MSDVWFIRHGECTANIGEATKTTEGACLTSTGREQAWLIANYILQKADRRPTRIITSSYVRARQTAQPTCNCFDDASFQIWDAVREFSYLVLPSNISTTKTDRLPLVKAFWDRCNPSFQHGSRAESFESFITRVRNVIRRLREYRNEELILIFSHFQFIQAVKWLLENEIERRCMRSEEMSHFYQLLKEAFLPNGAILKTRLDMEGQAVLSCEISHLSISSNRSRKTNNSRSSSQEDLST